VGLRQNGKDIRVVLVATILKGDRVLPHTHPAYRIGTQVDHRRVGVGVARRCETGLRQTNDSGVADPLFKVEKPFLGRSVKGGGIRMEKILCRHFIYQVSFF
jgi:hypothetical protein